MLLADPVTHGDAARERVAELMFESYAPPALFLARDAVLSCFATGRSTALVVDAGHDATTGECVGRERGMIGIVAACPALPCPLLFFGPPLLATRCSHAAPAACPARAPAPARATKKTDGRRARCPSGPARHTPSLLLLFSNEELLDARLERLNLGLELRPFIRGHAARDDRPRHAARAAKGGLGRHKDVGHVLERGGGGGGGVGAAASRCRGRLPFSSLPRPPPLLSGDTPCPRRGWGGGGGSPGVPCRPP